MNLSSQVESRNPNDKKRTKNNLTFLDKCRICKELLGRPKPTQEELAVKYNVTQTAISKIFKDKDKYLALIQKSRKRNDNMKQSTMDDFVTKK